MAVAGVDVGSANVCAVILEGDDILSYSIISSGEEGAVASREAMEEAARRAGLAPADIEYVVSTGCGRSSVPFANKQSAEVVCQARGAHWLFPSARTVVNLGAESSRAIRLDEAGKVQSFVTNDKCAAGSGVFLETMAKVLEVPLEEMGEIALGAGGVEEVSSRCAVFAESEVISHIHRGIPREQVLAGLHKAVADRILEIASKAGIGGDVAVTGGMAKNIAIIRELDAPHAEGKE